MRKEEDSTQMKRIEKKIIKYSVAQGQAEDLGSDEVAPEVRKEDQANVIRMHENLERPEELIGTTYKVKTPVADHAMYVTINDIVLNEGSKYEKRRPFEIFIN